MERNQNKPTITNLIVIIFISVIIFGILGYYIANNRKTSTAVSTPVPIISTQTSEIGPNVSPQITSSPSPNTFPSPNTKRSGIYGLVTIGPICGGGVRIPPEPKCADKPYSAVISIQTTDGKEVTRVTSATDGKYTVFLSAGKYNLVPLPPSGNDAIPPRGGTITVTVEKDSMTKADISYDSGIR